MTGETTNWRRLYRLAKPFFFDPGNWRGKALLGLLLCFLLSIKGFDVVMSYIGRDFMTSLNLRDKAGFMSNFYKYLAAFALAVPLVVLYRYTEERLALMWRRWLSLRTFDKYFANHSYYRLGWYPGIDNPDQRIEEDIRSFTTTSLSLFLIFLQSIISITLFIGVLYSISLALTLTAIAYAAIGSVATYYLGRPLIWLNYEQLKREANYRYKLINVRDHAESIAFYRDERIEKTRVRQRMKEALENLLRIINRNRTLNFFTTGYNYFLIVLPTMVVAPLYLDGEIEFGVVTQSTIAFGHVLNALSVIVTNFGSLSAYAAVVRRLGAFMEALDQTELEQCQSQGNIKLIEGDNLNFNNVTVHTPDKNRVVMRELSFTLEAGGLLIFGPSGSGKSTILRAASGIWRSGTGEITRPLLSDCMFVPQRPYLVLGSIRSQLLYGQKKRSFSDKELIEVVQQVELTEMLGRIGGLDSQQDFSNSLSTGEQQRIAMARVILARPKYVFLDEATTAIDEDEEARMYGLLKNFTQFIVSVGSRSSLKRFHSLALDLKGDGTWKLSKIRSSQA